MHVCYLLLSPATLMTTHLLDLPCRCHHKRPLAIELPGHLIGHCESVSTRRRRPSAPRPLQPSEGEEAIRQLRFVAAAHFPLKLADTTGSPAQA